MFRFCESSFTGIPDSYFLATPMMNSSEYFFGIPTPPFFFAKTLQSAETYDTIYSNVRAKKEGFLNDRIGNHAAGENVHGQTGARN